MDLWKKKKLIEQAAEEENESRRHSDVREKRAQQRTSKDRKRNEIYAINEVFHRYYHQLQQAWVVFLMHQGQGHRASTTLWAYSPNHLHTADGVSNGATVVPELLSTVILYITCLNNVFSRIF